MRRALFLLLLLAGAAVFRAAPNVPTDRFDRTKSRIEALLGRRLHPVALPDKAPNPFFYVGPPPETRTQLFEVATEPNHPAPPKTEPSGVPTTGDEDVLAYFSAMIKVTGQLQVNGQPLLIINQAPYKEGDLLQMHGKDGITYYLRVIKISPNEVTLGYNDAIRAVPYKN